MAEYQKNKQNLITFIYNCLNYCEHINGEQTVVI